MSNQDLLNRLPTFRTFVLCPSALCMGHTQLPQAAISPNAPAILPRHVRAELSSRTCQGLVTFVSISRHVRVEVFTPRNFFKNALFGGKNCKSIISTTQNYSVILQKGYTPLKSRELEELPRFRVISWQPFQLPLSASLCLLR